MYSILSSCPLQILVLMIIAYTPKLVHSATLQSDIQVLESFKTSIDPISITAYCYLNSWDFSMDPCETTGGFLGILCSFPLDGSSNRIMAIDLDAAGYDGFLTPAVGNLTELTILGLSKNKFRGPIAETIANLKKLTRLVLSENVFTGNIPVGITELKQLEIVDLSQNHFSGSIPAEISGLRRLTRLILSNNQLAGRIPDLPGLWQLDALDLADNLLYGNLPKFPKHLRTLFLGHNMISGHMSPVKVLQYLTFLDVSDNRFSGRILEAVLTLPRVTHVNVSFNQFTAVEPINIPLRETRLQVLDAHGNQLHGHLPTSLAAAENLTYVDLSYNRFFGPIPMEYGAKLGRSWKRLFLNNNFLIGNLPPRFNRTKAVRGSLANNCLRCPKDIPLCSGGQRRESECIGHNNNAEEEDGTPDA